VQNTVPPCCCCCDDGVCVVNVQGYRYWAGVGVEASCETALVYYQKVAAKGAFVRYTCSTVQCNGKKLSCYTKVKENSFFM
jgi:hypothetical protein